MSQAVVVGANCMCSFGTTPAPLKVTSQSAVVIGGSPAATIQDSGAMTNVGPFGMCTTLSNPQVASATTAALGVLTPQPCTPMPAGTWIPTQQTALINGKPALTQDCKMVCAYAGQITITLPGQASVTIG